MTREEIFESCLELGNDDRVFLIKKLQSVTIFLSDLPKPKDKCSKCNSPSILKMRGANRVYCKNKKCGHVEVLDIEEENRKNKKLSKTDSTSKSGISVRALNIVRSFVNDYGTPKKRYGLNEDITIEIVYNTHLMKNIRSSHGCGVGVYREIMDMFKRADLIK